MKTTVGALLALVTMILFVVSVGYMSWAKAEEVTEDEPTQPVLAVDKDDAKVCKEPGACMLVTPNVLKDIARKLNACADLKDLKNHESRFQIVVVDACLPSSLLCGLA